MRAGSELIGRNEQRARLREAFEAADAGQSRAVLIEGPAGMGKTRLVRAFLTDLDPGTIVGWGTCWHGEGAPGFWPWTQVIEDLATQLGEDEARAAAGDGHEVLGALAPVFGTPNEARDPDGRRAELLVAAVRWIRAVAADRAVVLVFDDLQWADASSLELLVHALSAASRSRLLVIGAFRSDELAPDDRRHLHDLGGEISSLVLDGLSLDEVEQLVVHEAGEAARHRAAELHARTGGHPLFVAELARQPDPGRGQLPAALADAVARRLDAVPAQTRSALDVAAVIGNEVRFDVIAAVLGLDVMEVHTCLTTAVDRGFLRDEHGVRFAHDIFREALDAALSTAERIRIHAEVAGALLERLQRGAPTPAGDVSHHLRSALPMVDAATAARWAHDAAHDERRRSAFAEAAKQLRLTRTRIEQSGAELDPDGLRELVLDEIEMTARSGAPDRARDLVLSSIESAPRPADVTDYALALQRLGARFATRRDEVLQVLRRALDLVGGSDVKREARVTAALARELMHSVEQDREDAATLSERALELGRESGDDATLLDCLLARHDAIWLPGTGAARAELASEIVALARRIGDPDRLADGLLLQANGMLEAGDAGFRSTIAAWFELLETRGEPRDRYLVETRRAALALLDADLETAARLIDEAAVLGHDIREPDTENVRMSQRVAYAHATGDPDVLSELARDAVAHWEGAPVHAHAVAAGALAIAGELAAATRELDAVEAHGGWRHETSYLRSAYLPYLAAAAAALGRAALCRELLVEVEALADDCGVNGAVVAFSGPFAATAALLAEAVGDADRAVGYRARAEEIARRLGARTWIGDAAAGVAESGPRLSRAGRVWSVSWRGEEGTIPHSKGLVDIATLVRNPGVPIAALALASGGVIVDEATIPVVDRQALGDYRRRLGMIDHELDEALAANDLGRAERLEIERDGLLDELRSVTGFADRVRPAAGDQAERARKAVSARIRDAIRRLGEVTPQLAGHLDRSIATGLRCCYAPPLGEPELVWEVDSAG